MSWFLLFLLVPIAWLLVAFLPSSRSSRHQRCLAHIDALERELFPEWFASLRVGAKIEWIEDALDISPGAVWQVDHHDQIAVIRTDAQTTYMAELAKRNQIHSAALKRQMEAQRLYGKAD